MEETILRTGILPLHSFLEFCHSFDTLQSIEELSRIVLENAMDAFNAERGIFFLNENGTFLPKLAMNYTGEAACAVGTGLTQYYLQRHRTGILHARAPYDDVKVPVLNEHGAANVMCAPFYAAGSLFGALYLDTTDLESHFIKTRVL